MMLEGFRGLHAVGVRYVGTNGREAGGEARSKPFSKRSEVQCYHSHLSRLILLAMIDKNTLQSQLQVFCPSKMDGRQTRHQLEWPIEGVWDKDVATG